MKFSRYLEVNMKIIVISDSHGNKLAIDQIFKAHKFDYLFFLGDGLGDLGDYVYLDNVFAVSGNCDFFSGVPNEREFEINNIKFLITHGNKYFVKSNLNFLKERVWGENIDFVLFGHTHNQIVEKYLNTTFINPGSFHKDLNGKSKGIILDIESRDKYSINDLII